MIYGERIRLRANERADIPLFVQWLNDPEVIRHLTILSPLSQAAEEQWFENMLKQPSEEQPLAIEVRDNPAAGENWKLIGNCSFMDIAWRTASAEAGIFIGDKTEWNKGYGTETMRLLLRHGFESLNLNRIFLRVDDDNLGGIRCYEKVGFIHEGRLRQAHYREGKYLDLLIMSILHSEWNDQNKDQRQEGQYGTR